MRQMILLSNSLTRLINVNDLPHHFNGSLAAFIVENTTELTGEMIEVNRISVGRGSVVN